MPSIKLSKDWFQRGVRMTHRFGELSPGDPIGTGTFEVKLPYFGEQSSPSATKAKQGQHDYYSPLSPVVKPNGVRAAYNGPQVDIAEELAYPTPAGTKKRKSFK